jgi:capsular exopolysaccharide synthesis family protein
MTPPGGLLRVEEDSLPRKFILPEAFSVELHKLKDALLCEDQDAAVTSKSILFSSVLSKGGSTTIISSFAICLAAKNGMRTLLLDANLRRPRLHKVFDAGERKGLAEVLLQQSEPEQCIVDSPVPNLSILPAGSDLSSLQSILNSSALPDLFQHLRSRFQVILVDSSSVSEYSDFKTFTPLTNGVVLVIEADKTHWRVAQKGQRSIEEAGAPFLGYVLNKKRQYIPKFLLSGTGY